VASTVSLGVEGGVPVVRQRADAADADRLRRTAAQLERAAHPGVVRIVSSGPVGRGPAGDGWELVTEHGGLALGSARLGSVEAVARLGSAVATTLADLHERGVVHGRLDATRILLGPNSRPVLCGLRPADAGGGAGPTTADDVAALGAVLTALLGSIEPAGGVERARRDALSAVLDRASAEPATRRPSARRLAGELAVPDARSVTNRPARARPAVVACAALAVVVVALVLARRPAAPTAASAASAATTGAPAARPTTTPTTEARTCVARSGHALAPASCAHEVVVDGPVIVVDGQRYVVGLEGDEVAVGDWDCDGDLRAAVLRPSTGEVRVFAPFTPDRTLAVATAERVAGARSLEVRTVDGCPTLGVLDPAATSP
jgi:hypothetical protein